MGHPRHALLAAAVALSFGCGGEAEPAGDGGPADGATTGDSFVDIPWLATAVPPLALTPCPDGWRTLDGDPVECRPYPEGGPADCPAGEAHFPGTAGCAAIGPACPVDDFAEALPTDRNIVFVQPGAVGGDGTRASPYGAISEFSVGSLPAQSVIALSRGTHVGPFRLVRGHTLWGACAADTVLQVAAPSDTEAVVTMQGVGGEVRAATISDSPRPGVWVSGAGNEARLDGVLVLQAQWLGVIAVNDARLVANGLVVQDTRAQGDGTSGRGLDIELGATVELTRAIIAGNRDTGVFGIDEGTAITLADVAIRDTRSMERTGTGGRGLNVQEGATADVRRSVFEGNLEIGAFASDPGSAMVLSDVLIGDTGSRLSDGTGGRGLHVRAGASGEASRVVIEGNREVGIAVNAPGSSVVLSDVIVRDTDVSDAGRFGRALAVQDAATVDVSRALFERARDISVAVSGTDTEAVLTDVVVRETLGLASDGSFGRGVATQRGSRTELRRALVEGNRDVGVIASSGATASLSDVVIRDIAALSDDIAGHGLGAYEAGTRVMASGFAINGAALCGVHLADAAEMDLERGEVRANSIGVCLQVDGYDVGRLMGEVRYVDNDVNLDSTSLPIPSPADDAVPIGP